MTTVHRTLEKTGKFECVVLVLVHYSPCASHGKDEHLLACLTTFFGWKYTVLWTSGATKASLNSMRRTKGDGNTLSVELQAIRSGIVRRCDSRSLCLRRWIPRTLEDGQYLADDKIMCWQCG